ncbi:MAG: PilC/PilY family type IV pilus protein [Pseudomonadota bacterium]
MLVKTFSNILGSLLFVLLPASVWAVTFATRPLYIPLAAPPNLLLSLSVEFPLAGTAAYKASESDLKINHEGYMAPGHDLMVAADTAFQPAKVYDGYFDSNKCYHYISNGSGNSLNDEYFKPAGYAPDAGNSYSCERGQGRAWNGNFLNWLTTSSLDVFRKYLTGGTRDVDSPTATRIVRSWMDGKASELSFPDVWLCSGVVTKYTAITPFNKPYIVARGAPSSWGQGGLAEGHPGWYWGCRFNSCMDTPTVAHAEPHGDRMRIIDPADTANEATGFNWSTMPRNRFPRISVAVCDASSGIESNCQPYSKNGSNQYYKPIGLIQQYQNKARFGAYSYVNVDFATHHAGGVMRSPLKSINGSMPDSKKEIDDATGVFIFDPESFAGGSSNTVYQPLGRKNSGLINYINQFGSIAGPSGWRYVQGDTTGELLYESLRYLALPYTKYPTKIANATPEFMKDIATSAPFQSMNTDGFPIFSSYKDPLINACQKNNLVFIGDANQNCDGRIPGGVYSPDAGEVCTKLTPSNTVPGLNVKAWIDVMSAYEGGDLINSNILRCPGGASSDRGCWGDITPNLAGLAFWAHAGDIRSDLPDRQSVDIFTLDVHEQLSPGRLQNDPSIPFGRDPTPYWLAAKYGGFTIDEKTAHPNARRASWDANNDGVPDNFLMADTPFNIKNGLSKIFTHVDDQTRTIQSNGHIALSKSLNPSAETQVYKTLYYNQGNAIWQGNLMYAPPTYTTNNGVVTYNLNNAIDFNVVLNNTNHANTPNAAKWLLNATVNGKPRQIITAKRTAAGAAIKGSPFTWSSIGNYLQGKMLQTGDTATIGNQRLDYVRGDRSHEESKADINGFRARGTTVLGDIIDSSPVYVGISQSGFSASDFPKGTPSFATFAKSVVNRRPLVYVGANDGMLHGFDAITLQEVFAFIPNSVFSKLKSLSSQTYTHDFFVNETPIVTEVVLNGAWSTQLIGFPGAGGSGVFALDITSPTKLAAAETNAQNIVLWELNSETDGDIGNILNRGQVNRNHDGLSMQVAKMSNNRWALITGNGYNAPNNSTALIVAYVDVSGGTPSYKKILTGTTGGLSTPTPVDIDLDGKVDFAYAGDLNGNLWRFDLRGDPATWSVTRIFRAVDSVTNTAQSISTAPSIMYHCTKTGVIVVFGTGQYFAQNDGDTTQIQSMYGISDDLTNLNLPINRSMLQSQSILSTEEATPGTSSSAVSSLIVTSNSTVNWSTQRGWSLDLATNRVVVPPYIVNGNVYFYTMKADASSCNKNPVWSSYLSLSACTGQRPDVGVFDINFDGKVDSNDQLMYNNQSMYASGANLGDTGSAVDSSVWIKPKAFKCGNPPCSLLKTAYTSPIGVNLKATPNKRVSWREVILR